LGSEHTSNTVVNTCLCVCNPNKKS